MASTTTAATAATCGDVRVSFLPTPGTVFRNGGGCTFMCIGYVCNNAGWRTDMYVWRFEYSDLSCVADPKSWITSYPIMVMFNPDDEG